MYLSASIAYMTFYLENPEESTEMPFLTQEGPLVAQPLLWTYLGRSFPMGK